MTWTAVVPLKQGEGRKSRLSVVLSAHDRGRLSDLMAGHVFSALAEAPSVSRVLSLSAQVPSIASADWRQDRGRGLNAELTAVMAEPDLGPLLILHGDLPLIQAEDIEALIAAAGAEGAALAPDRHGTGTNAMAVAAGGVVPAFGEQSFARHLAAISPSPAVVRRTGLALDVDTPDDLRAALEAGFRFIPSGAGLASERDAVPAAAVPACLDAWPLVQDRSAPSY